MLGKDDVRTIWQIDIAFYVIAQSTDAFQQNKVESTPLRTGDVRKPPRHEPANNPDYQSIKQYRDCHGDKIEQ
jgi:hypothetical protein